MLTLLPQKFNIQPIVNQVNELGYFGKRLDLNSPTGKFFNDPWHTKAEFKGTPLGEVLDSLGTIGQARLLSLDSAESYTAHSDPDDRIHLAIVTNPYSFLIDVENSQMYHLPVDGNLWYMDTGPVHVATNWGGRPRIHLNIRMLLPSFDITRPGFSLKIIKGDVDWKQESYIEIMGTINRLIKQNKITGFESVNEKELFINIDDCSIGEHFANKIKSKNIKVEFKTF